MTRLVIGSDLFMPSIGGTETVTKNMAENLPAHGYEVTVIAPAVKGRKGPYYEKSDNGYNILRVRSFDTHAQADLRFGLRPYKQIADYLDEVGRPDIIHVNNLFPISRALIRYARRNNVPVVVGSHLMPHSYTFGLHNLHRIYDGLNGLGWHYIARVYNKADMVVAPTKTAIRYLTKAGLKVPTRAISNGIDLAANKPLHTNKDTLRRELKIPGERVIIYAGRLGVEKEIDVLLDGFAKEYHKFDATLVLMGDGNARAALEKQADKLKIKSRVVFAGFVQDREQKKQYLAASDVFAIASPVELQSLVTMEAMAAGLPVIAVNSGALPELAQDGKNGYVFAEGDSEDFAERLYSLLSHPSDLEKFGKASLEIISHHDIKDTWRQYDAMYKDVLAHYIPKA